MTAVLDILRANANREGMKTLTRQEVNAALACTVTITAANADKAQTVMNAGQKAMWAYRDWLRCPNAELRAQAERKRDLYEKHRLELING